MSDPAQPSSADLPSDPLLEPGAFIDANDQNQSTQPTKARNCSIPNGVQPETPAPGLVNTSSSSADPKSKRRVMDLESWLPPGWSIVDRVRTSGVTAGLVDKYYVDPFSGRKFRSKKEVLYFLENGSLQPKGKKRTETAGSEVPSTGNSAGNKKMSAKKPKPLNFDFVNVPEKIDWFLTNACSDSWSPCLRNEPVPESTTQDWAAAFTSLTASKTRLGKEANKRRREESGRRLVEDQENCRCNIHNQSHQTPIP